MVPAKALAREARATRCVTLMPPSQGSRAFPFAPVFTNAFCLYRGCPRNTKRRIPNVECASAMQKRPSALLLPKPTNLDHALFRAMQVNRRLLLSVMLGKDYSIGFGNITYYMNPPPPSPQPTPSRNLHHPTTPQPCLVSVRNMPTSSRSPVENPADSPSNSGRKPSKVRRTHRDRFGRTACETCPIWLRSQRMVLSWKC